MPRKKGEAPPDLGVVEGGLAEEPEEPDAHAEFHLERLNKEYAYLSTPGLVVRYTEDAQGVQSWVELRPQSFKMTHSTTWVRSGNGYARLGKRWLEGWSGRRTYKDTVFAPDRKPGGSVRGYLNTWTGFAVEPDKKGDCSLFLEHVHDNIAQGNDDHYQRILAWMAKVVQRPRERTGIALVLTGGSGTGKSTLAKVLGGLYSRANHLTFNSYDSFTGDFNEELERCVLLSAEEAVFAADKRKQGILYDLLTNCTLMVHPKGKAKRQADNWVHMIITSNHDWACPARMDDRRFMVFHSAMPNTPEPRAYFDALYAQMDEQKGYSKLLYILQQFDLDAVDLRDIPQTKARLTQMVNSLESAQAYMFTVAYEGSWPLVDDEWPDGPGWPTAALYDDYVRWAKAQGDRHPVGRHAFGWLVVNKLGVKKRGRPACYAPGPLWKFRLKVAKVILMRPDFEWPEEEEDGDY